MVNLVINFVFLWWNSCIWQVFNDFVKIWFLFHLICGIEHFWFEMTISHGQIDFCCGPNYFCCSKYYRWDDLPDVGDSDWMLRFADCHQHRLYFWDLKRTYLISWVLFAGFLSNGKTRNGLWVITTGLRSLK